MTPFHSWLKKTFTFQAVMRMIADAVMINVALIFSLVARLLWLVAIGNPAGSIDVQQSLFTHINYYIGNAWALTIVCWIVFALSGFYTYGRFYRGRYKVLIVFQATSLAFIIFGFLTYLAQSDFLGIRTSILNFPRWALIMTWGLSTLMLVASRAWSFIWKNILRVESRRAVPLEEENIKNVLVIGGAGYIGSALLPKLLDAGYHVRLLDLLIYGTDPIKEWLTHPHLEIVQADFRQVEKVVQAMHDMNAVIHLGGLVGDSACALDEQLTMDINLMATRMIAEVAKGSGIGHFIFASTCSVYGASDQMLDERSELRPVSLYARSKIASEKVLLKMADEHFAPVILRFSTIYGLSGRPRFDLVVNLLSAKAVVENEITIFGGDQWRPFLHVADAALSIMKVLRTPLRVVRNQIFNVGSNEQNFTIRQVGEMIQQQVPSAVIVDKEEMVDPRNYWVNFTKIKRTLEFTPEWHIEKGITQVIDALRSGRIQDYRDARYSNIKFLTQEGILLLTQNKGDWATSLINEESIDIPAP